MIESIKHIFTTANEHAALLQAVLSAVAILAAAWIATRQTKKQHENAILREAETLNGFRLKAKILGESLIVNIKAFEEILQSKHSDAEIAENLLLVIEGHLQSICPLMDRLILRIPEDCVIPFSLIHQQAHSCKLLFIVIRMPSEEGIKRAALINDLCKSRKATFSETIKIQDLHEKHKSEYDAKK